MKYGIVVSDFNPDITGSMLQECLRGFKEQGIEATVIHVPGAVEIPLIIQDYIKAEKPMAVVALGCVIKGDTEHYDQVCNMTSQGIMDVMLRTHTPVVFEVLMVDQKIKAEARIQKGYEAAFTAVQMAKLIGSAS